MVFAGPILCYDSDSSNVATLVNVVGKLLCLSLFSSSFLACLQEDHRVQQTSHDLEVQSQNQKRQET